MSIYNKRIKSDSVVYAKRYTYCTFDALVNLMKD
jgi:hypothetical protein